MATTRSNQTTPGSVLAGCLALVVLAAVFLGIVVVTIQSASFIVTRLSNWGADVDAEVMAVIISVPLTSLVTFWATTRDARNRTLEQTNSQKKDIYSEVTRLLTKTFDAIEKEDQQALANDSELLNDLAVKILTHGNSNVVKSFKQWRIAKESNDLKQMLLSTSKLLLEMRKDLKMNNRGINGSDLLRCICNDERLIVNPDHRTINRQDDVDPVGRI